MCRRLSSAKPRSAPPTDRSRARTGVGTQRRPTPAIRVVPPRRRTAAAAETAAGQIGKRCQLSNRTCHGCIIAHTYDNAGDNAYPLSWSTSPSARVHRRQPGSAPELVDDRIHREWVLADRTKGGGLPECRRIHSVRSRTVRRTSTGPSCLGPIRRRSLTGRAWTPRAHAHGRSERSSMN